MTKLINLTEYEEDYIPHYYKTIMVCHIRLDKKTMLNILLNDYIKINGELYKVPEDIILNCLINKRFGETKLELEKLED